MNHVSTLYTHIQKEFNIWDRQHHTWIIKGVSFSTSLQTRLNWATEVDWILCESIGLTDIVGQKIFEFDIVKNKYGNIYYIKYMPNQCRFNISQDAIERRKIDVIGNIFDNLDLLPEIYQEKVRSLI